MARIRTIKPSFFRDHGIAELPLTTRLTFIGLWTYVDDDGRGVDDARLVKGDLWQLDDSMTVKKVERDLALLAEGGFIIRYTMRDRHFLAITNWSAHQKINRPTPSLLPAPPLRAHGAITEDSPGEGNREEGKEAEAFLPATVDVDREVADRIRRRRSKGEDIGPRLEEIIREDVVRDLAQLKTEESRSKCEHCAGRFALGTGWMHRSGCPELSETA